ncbi:MAG TPA: 2-dehydro-3-deoxygalactonokinase, partial [Niastella sp.]|nr:2-dehydro-3-deoxygalactonokinase [Niastella sp.]
MRKCFLSCDWGTSSFRLRLVDSDGFRVIAESYSEEGVTTVYQQWQQQAKPETERLHFYKAVLKKHISKLEQQLQTSLDAIPIVISGMASSTIGMVELPYTPLPFHTDGSDLYVSNVKSTADFKHDMVIISGARTASDVMRGEEVQVIGYTEAFHELQLVIIPGTHSKHIVVQDNKVVD